MQAVTTTQRMNEAIDDSMPYREPFFQRACGGALAELSQTLRFFAARTMRDKISDDTLAWYRRMYSDANGGWAHRRTLLRDAAARRGLVSDLDLVCARPLRILPQK